MPIKPKLSLVLVHLKVTISPRWFFAISLPIRWRQGSKHWRNRGTILANRAIKKNVNKKAQSSVHERGSFSKSKTLEIWSIENNNIGARRYEISRRRVEHEKRNSISTSNHVLFCLSYKHNSPFLGRKSDLINECK